MWRQVLILAAVVDLLLLVGCGWADRILVGSNRRLVDDAGRERFFHGVNAVYKSRPYIPRTDQYVVLARAYPRCWFSLPQGLIRRGASSTRTLACFVILGSVGSIPFCRR